MHILYVLTEISQNTINVKIIPMRLNAAIP